MATNKELDATADRGYAQLIQVTATISEASELFASNDPAAPMPIVVVPRYQNRLINPLLISALAVAGISVAVFFWLELTLEAAGAGLVALLLGVLGVRSAFSIVIPEGMHALLAKSGRYTRTVGAGYHVLPPRVVVSHLVTARAIPYAVLVRQAPTADLVRADVDGMITFLIEDPAAFVFRTSTGAFDEILQASCQDALRATVRQRPAAGINDIGDTVRIEMRKRVASDVTGYGVQITSVNITRALLPEPFMQSQEARQLAILQQEEQAEQQTLALRRQADGAELARQEVVAEVARQHEHLRAEAQMAEVRRKVAELDTETLRNYPNAVHLELLRRRLEVAKALAANTRAIVRVGAVSDFEQLVSLDGDSLAAATEGQFVIGD